MESAILSDDIDEEEVWLYWIDSNKEPHGKAIRHLAQEAKEGTKADLEVLTYYRLSIGGNHSQSHTFTERQFSEPSESQVSMKKKFKKVCQNQGS